MGASGGTAVALWCEILTSWLNVAVAMTDLFSRSAAEASFVAATDASLLSRIGSQVFVWGSVAVGIGLVIFVHELGHFLAAKVFGVKVEKFYVGFDVPIKIGPIRFPRTLGKFRWGETEYGIGVIPLGGYVKMLGQDDDPRKAEEEAARIRQKSSEPGADADADEEVPAELDPRSYPAKSVGQRMVIISAGVVMNVISGILFAAFAYGALGVDYTPAIVGGVTPGDPAYEAGIELNGKVISVDGSEDDEQMHFQRMMTQVLTHGMARPDEPVSLRIRYPEEVREYKLQTSTDPQMPMRHLVGIAPPALAQIASEPAWVAEPDTPAASVLEDEDAGADILSVDGEALAVNELIGAPLNHQVMRRMIQRADQPVTLTLRRTGGEERSVTIEPQRMKTLGFDFALGPIATLVRDGPAEQAGVEVGDRILSVNGEAPLSAFRLPLQVLKIDGSVSLRIRRGVGDEAKELDIEIEPRPLESALGPFASPTGKISLDTLGLAYRPAAVVVTSDATGIEVGDKVLQIKVQWPDQEVPDEYSEIISPQALKSISEGWELSQTVPMTTLVELLQVLPDGSKFEVVLERAADEKVVERTGTLSHSEAYWPTRGLIFAPARFVHEADSFADAMGLGLREARWRMGEVFQFLKLLGTGKVSRQQVGGPVKIAQIAAGEAERGWAPLLLFLTFLSMNLAILNFLPIPALDGGHMLFLVAEAVLGRPVNEKLQMQLTMIGVMALLALMLFVFANDLILP